jgi:hypothetical protein
VWRTIRTPTDRLCKVDADEDKLSSVEIGRLLLCRWVERVAKMEGVGNGKCRWDVSVLQLT